MILIESKHFLWNKKSNFPPVAWDDVCVPKSHGGLRIRKSNHLNMAFLAKLGKYNPLGGNHESEISS